MAGTTLLLKHNDHYSKIKCKFQEHRETGHFVDVTLSCVSKSIKCHQLVLSSCSYYFRDLLVNNPSHNPIIFLRDVDFEDLKLLVDFMYSGEVAVNEKRVPAILRLAADLQIIGLTDGDKILCQMKQSVLEGIHDLNTEVEDSSSEVNTNSRQSEEIAELKEENNSDAKITKKRKRSTTPPVPRISVRKNLIEEKKDDSIGFLDSDSMSIKQESIDIDDDPVPGTHFIQEFDDGAGSSNVSDLSSLALNNVECVIGTDKLNKNSNGTQGPQHQEHNYTAGDAAITLSNILNLEDKDEETISDNELKEDLKLGPYKPVNFNAEHNLPSINVKAPSIPLLPMIPNQDVSIANRTKSKDAFNRIRRSEEELQKAAEMVRGGMTFQTASDTYNIPISTIRFYMARRGILPQRRRGRASNGNKDDDLIHPPFEIIHYRLPDIDKPM